MSEALQRNGVLIDDGSTPPPTRVNIIAAFKWLIVHDIDHQPTQLIPIYLPAQRLPPYPSIRYLPACLPGCIELFFKLCSVVIIVSLLQLPQKVTFSLS